MEKLETLSSLYLHNIKEINDLKVGKLNCNAFSVYDYNGYTLQELICQLSNKINEVIDTSNNTIDLVEWLTNEGLTIEVALTLEKWCNDGTLEEIINKNLFNSLDEKIETNTSNVNKTREHFNNFLNDYKGICVRTWIEGSLYNERYRNGLLNLLNETNANSIILTTNSYQSDETSNNPFTREPITLKEIEDYFIFLKDNCVRILFKPHVEIDELPYIWRANINPSNITEWFMRYKDKMLEYATLCEKYNVECFSVGSEYRTLSEKYPNLWVDLINEIRNVYSGKLTYGSNMNNDTRDEINDITFWNELDYIGVDFYVVGIDDGDYNEHVKSFYHSKNHKNTKVLLDSVSNKFNKPIMFCEYGMHVDNTTITNRCNYIRATQDVFLNSKNSCGGFIWVYDQNNTDWFENDSKLKNIFRSRNISNKVNEVNKYYLTPKSASDSSNYSLFATYNLENTYVDSSITLNFEYRGLTNSIKEMFADIRIRVSTNDDINNPIINYEIENGNVSTENFIYKINGNVVEFYVKVDNYSQVFFKVNDSSDFKLFDIYEYQEFKNVEDFTTISHKYMINENIDNITMRVGDDKNLCCGSINTVMNEGIIDENITLPIPISQVYSINVNVNYVGGGESYDVIVNGQYVGNNQINIRGKHLTNSGGYGVSLSYTVVYK